MGPHGYMDAMATGLMHIGYLARIVDNAFVGQAILKLSSGCDGALSHL